MNLRQIEIFRSIMLTGSVSGAGRLLSISQPAISRTLKQMEDQVGMRLFQRVGGGLKPTHEAERLFVDVELLYRGIQKVQMTAQDLRAGHNGTLRVASTPSIGQQIIPRVIGDFHREHRNIVVHYDVLKHDEIIDAMSSGHFDIAVSIMNTMHPNISSSVLFNSQLVCLCRKDHPLADYDVLTPDDVLAHPIVLQGSSTPIGSSIQQFLMQGRSPPMVTCDIKVTNLACSLVTNGLGIAIVDEHSFDLHQWEDLRMISLQGRPSIRYYLLTSLRNPLSIFAESFIDTLRGLLRRNRGLVAAR